jgi:hypothetical protein
MKIRILLSPVVLAGAFLLTHAAHAKTISISGHGASSVKKGCGGGGVFFPPNKNGVYACLNGDGSGIVCGGTGKFAKTCDTWGPTPGDATTRTKPTQEDFDTRAAGRVE